MSGGVTLRSRRRKALSRRERPVRIFVGLIEIAGHYGSLSRALAECGAEVTYVNLSGAAFGYQSGPPVGWVARMCMTLSRRQASTQSRSVRSLWRGAYLLSKVLLLVWAAARHDVFVYGFRTTFFRGRELPLLKLLRKRLIFVFHGTDIRPSYLDGSDMALSRGATIEDLVRVTRNKQRDLDRIERYADVLVSHPSFSHLLRRSFVTFLSIGIPAPVRETATATHAVTGPVRILHSPSDLEVKGTARIREAVTSLEAEGFEIEYVEIVGQPNAVVLDELRRCDIVVDQLYSDTPMAAFATEAATVARAAVVGSYDWAEVCRGVADEDVPPTYLCRPDELKETLRRLVTDANLREEAGRRAQAFVRERWTPEAVAARFLQLAVGDVPTEWTAAPADIRYVHGVGLDEKRLRELVRGVLEHSGPSALLLDDKPELLRRVLDLASD